MIDLSKLADEIRAGQRIPVSFTLDGVPASLERRDETATDVGWDVRYDVAGAPIDVTLHLRRDEPFDLLHFSADLHVRQACQARLGDVRIAELRVEHPDPDVGVTLRTSTGGTVKHYSHSSFPPCCFQIDDRLLRGHDIARFQDDTGRGSNEILPIWLYGLADSGMWFAPRWQGTWALEVHRLPEYTSILLSLHRLDFIPRAGERIELPEMTVGAYRGDLADGCNRIRRVIAERYLPEIGGERPQPPLAYQMLGGHPDWMSEPGIHEEVDAALGLGCESFTFSSFWQFDTGFKDRGNWWDLMGPYRPGPSRFPEGTQRLADHLADGGARLGLWVDPRIGLDSGQIDAHRDVLLFFDADAWEQEARGKYNPISYDINIQPLIDLSRPEGRQCLAGILDRMVDEHHARWIWYDLNDDPSLFHFVPNEHRDRRGLLELRYFQGMDEVMTALRKRHPDVWIEMCASGGRMINLAVLAYSHSLWITDYTGGDPDIAGAIRTGANCFLPAVCNHQSYYPPDRRDEGERPGETHALAHFAGVFGLSHGLMFYDEEDLALLERMGRVWTQHVRPVLGGDFYLLRPQATSRDDWEAWQFHDPDTGQGVVCVRRYSQSTVAEDTLTLRGLLAGATVDHETLLGDAETSTDGADLTLRFAEGPAVLIAYRAGVATRETTE